MPHAERERKRKIAIGNRQWAVSSDEDARTDAKGASARLPDISEMQLSAELSKEPRFTVAVTFWPRCSLDPPHAIIAISECHVFCSPRLC